MPSLPLADVTGTAFDLKFAPEKPDDSPDLRLQPGRMQALPNL